MAEESRVIRLARVPECQPEGAEARMSVQLRALQGACMILGSLEALARHLGVAQAEARAWLQASEPLPEPIFLAAVEILLLAAEPRGAPS